MLTFKIEKDADEFHTWCPELKGCHTHGATRQEALDNLKEAVALYANATQDAEDRQRAYEELHNGEALNLGQAVAEW